VRISLAYPVVGLLIGAGLGLQWPNVPASLTMAVACGWVVCGLHARRVRHTTTMAVCIAGVCGVAGVAMCASAWQRAWRPTTRLVFEAAARDARRDALKAGRALPDDDSASMVVVGRLRADGMVGATGTASLLIDAEWMGRVANTRPDADAASNPVHGGIAVTVVGALARTHEAEWRAGRRMRVTADLRRPARYLDPGVPDQERLLARRGTSLVGVVKSAALVEVLAPGSSVDEWAARVRDHTRVAINANVGVWSPRAAGIVTAILIGDRTGLEDVVERRLQESGTYHVIAISGGNIAILAGLTVTAFRLAGLLGRVAMLTAAAGLVVYDFIVGGGASVDRAVLMAVVYFVGRAWDLRGPPYQALLLAAGVLTIKDPLSVADPASLLTFGATAAIIAMSRLASASTVPAAARSAVAMLVASASTEVLLLPVSAAIFGRVTFAGLVLNFGAIPLMAVAQLAGMAVVPVSAVWPAASRLIGWLAFVGAEGLVRTADLVMLAPWSTWRVSPPGVGVVAMYYAAVASAWWLWRRALAEPAEDQKNRVQARGVGVQSRTTERQAGLQTRALTTRVRMRAFAPLAHVAATLAAVSAGLWIVGVRPTGGAAGDGLLHVTFIDVGQGDAALIRFPRGSTALIDSGGLGGGGGFDIGDRVVGPVLRQAGVAKLGTLVLTHGDADHIGGATSVLQEFRPWDVWDGVPVPPFEPLSMLKAHAAAAGSRWTTVQRADETVLDDVRVTVRHPPIPDWERQDVRNDDSIVLELRWRDVSFVFTGDIGRPTESEIGSLFEPARLRVVKVPHHGSITSSTATLVERLAPDVAVVSVGRTNPFGHPSARVLERYQWAGAAVFRTDRDGAVEVETDGHAMTVRGFTGREMHVTARGRARGG